MNLKLLIVTRCQKRDIDPFFIDQIAIYDATNTTKDRREMIKTFCDDSGIQVTKEKVVENIKNFIILGVIHRISLR